MSINTNETACIGCGRNHRVCLVNGYQPTIIDT
jgi:hypothetical protein